MVGARSQPLGGAPTVGPEEPRTAVRRATIAGIGAELAMASVRGVVRSWVSTCARSPFRARRPTGAQAAETTAVRAGAILVRRAPDAAERGAATACQDRSHDQASKPRATHAAQSATVRASCVSASWAAAVSGGDTMHAMPIKKPLLPPVAATMGFAL